MKFLSICGALVCLAAVGCSSAPRIPRDDAPRPDWEQVLEEGSSKARERAVRKLARLENDFAWDLIAGAASNEDLFARLAAAEVLPEWENSDEALSLLEILLSDESFLVRWQAINSLAETGSARAVEPLAKATLEDPDPLLRGEAARALGTLGRQEAIPHLVEALRHSQTSRSRSAAESLAQLTGEPVVPDYQAWKSYLAGDPEPLRAIAEQRKQVHEENRELADKGGRGVLSTIGRAIKRLFTRAR